MSAAQSRNAQLRVGFLFNHDHIHQVAHSAPIGFELPRMFPDVAVEMLVATNELSEAVRALAGETLPPRCTIDRLRASGPLAWIDPVIGSLLSFRRLAVLESSAARLDQLDAIVVPEKTTLPLRTHYGAKRVKLIHTRHGAGDRAVGLEITLCAVAVRHARNARSGERCVARVVEPREQRAGHRVHVAHGHEPPERAVLQRLGGAARAVGRDDVGAARERLAQHVRHAFVARREREDARAPWMRTGSA